MQSKISFIALQSTAKMLIKKDAIVNIMMREREKQHIK
jgi:hypothetical protein